MGLLCCAGAFLSCSEGKLLCVAVSFSGGFSCCRTLTLAVGVSVTAACEFSSCGLRALEPWLSSWYTGLSCSVACGIFWDQGLNQYALHCKGDS